MKINSIPWHQKSLKRQRSTYQRGVEELARVQECVDKLEKEVYFHQFQINEAIRQGKESFDPERFCSKTRKTMGL